MTYFKFQPDIHGVYGIADYPSVPDNVSFVAGQLIIQPLPQPLVFIVTNPPDHPPGHLMGSMIPVASTQFVEALKAAHVDNVQTFSAVLRNLATGQEWHDYVALNIVGLLDGADMSVSTYDTIVGSDALPPSGFLPRTCASSRENRTPSRFPYRSKSNRYVHGRLCAQ